MIRIEFTQEKITELNYQRYRHRVHPTFASPQILWFVKALSEDF